MVDLFNWPEVVEDKHIQRPEPVWPPDYDNVWKWRLQTVKRIKNNPDLIASAKKYYSTRPVEFILDWMDTYDPRRKGNKWVPFVLFPKQVEFINFLKSLDEEQENGLVEKSRDMGATWAACGYSIYCWLFIPNDATGWGSRKEALVDKIGEPDSIFEKIRLLLKRLPSFFLPDGFNWARDSTFMKLVNPSNGSVISGEAGDNIGRGGRKSRYLKDEAAHYERPEKIEAALGDNTNVQIDISSVNGIGTVFQKRRENGLVWEPDKKLDKGYVRVFVMDWRDHPLKTQDWYDKRKAKYEREGMAHIFAQEVDRNPSAAISNILIQYEWARSAIDAHIHIPYFADATPANLGNFMAGLDVADDGADWNSLSIREWVIWRYCEEWGERDPGVTARRAIIACQQYKGRIECMYDSIGVGSGVKTEYNRLTQDIDATTGKPLLDATDIPFIPWNAGAKVLNPYERIIPDDEQALTNYDYYDNLKAQAWGALAARFYKTHKARTEGAVYNPDELISLDSRMPLLDKLCKELTQPVREHSSRLKMIVNKKPKGISKSPNNADSGMQMFFPIPSNSLEVKVGSYGY